MTTTLCSRHEDKAAKDHRRTRNLACGDLQDPSAKKPEDWVDSPMMPDPNETKPDDWEDVPKTIPDPDATKPDDWDEAEDGEWTAPEKPNPDYKGEWRAPMIENPDYKARFRLGQSTARARRAKIAPCMQLVLV